MTSYKPVSPKDVFMHFLSIIMLYAAAISFLVVIFQIINLFLPDLLAKEYINSFQIQRAYDAMRPALAFLIITYPVYIVTVWLIKKSYAKDEYKKEMLLRKWLVYFTLFITALIIIGTLISVLISFLYGELTLAFALKIVSIFFVAGSVFGYYIFDLKNKYSQQLRYLFYTVTLITLIALIIGFYFVGSPSKQRLRNVDEDKADNLDELEVEINDYYFSNKSLPAKIDEFYAYKKDFAYSVVDDTHYKVCTKFNFASYGFEYSQKYNMTIPNNTTEHDAGKVCFKRKINQDLKHATP